MFSKIKKKAEEVKNLAEEKSREIDFSGIKKSMENSKSAIINSKTKAADAVKDLSANTKAAAAKSAEAISTTANEFDKKARSLLEATTQNTTATMSDVKAAAQSAIASSKKSAHAMHQKYGPTVEKIIINGLIGIAEEKLQDEIFLKTSLEKIYEFLPTPFRIMVDRDSFVNFCLDNKDPITLKIQEYKIENPQLKNENISEIPHQSPMGNSNHQQ